MPEYIVVTGGASGLGKAIAARWAKEKAHICVADIDTENGERIADELNKMGATAHFAFCDVTSEDNFNALATSLAKKWPQIDIVFNNAGVASAGALEVESIEQWQWVHNINVFGVVRGCRAFVGIFKHQGHGYFVNTASQAGLTPMPMMGSYNATKAAVVAFSETLKLELAHYDIGVTVACPAFFSTNLAKSMRSDDPNMHAAVERFFEKATLTAEDVANDIYRCVQRHEFMSVPDKIGSKVYLFKRLLPNKMYFKQMLKKTRFMRKK